MKHNKRNIKIISKNSFFLDKPGSGLPWIARVATEHWDKDFLFSRPGFGSCFLSYVQDGRISIEDDKGTLIAGPGDVIYLANEECSRVLQVLSQQGTKLIIMVLSEDISFNLMHNYLGAKNAVFTTADPASVEALFFCIYRSAEKAYTNSNVIIANLLLPTLQTIVEENRKVNEKSDADLLLFNRCREYIRRNCLEITSVTAAAEKFVISHSKLCRLFKKYENITPHNFLLKCKMAHAFYELHQQYCNVSEVAYKLGFSDPYSFSKTFKRIMGYSPSEAKL